MATLRAAWAYDRHDVGTTPGFHGDYKATLRSVRAKTIILAGPLDLYNPQQEAHEAATLIPNARYAQIPSLQGHFAASPAKPPDVAFANRRLEKGA